MKKELKKHSLLPLAILITISLLFLSACDDSSDSDDKNTDGDKLNPIGRWMVVLDEEINAPSPGEIITAKTLFMEITDDAATIVFFDNETTQIAGMKATYALDGSDIQFISTQMWLGTDPEEYITYDGKGWYEIPEEIDPIKTSYILDEDTLTVNKDDLDFALIRTTFETSSDLTGTWKKGEDDLVLNADGTMTFTYGASTGSGTWEASGNKTGYLRQIYTELSDDTELSYREYLSPYTLEGDTLTVYYDYTTEGYSEEYIKE
jgi:hypothetical protein